MLCNLMAIFYSLVIDDSNEADLIINTVLNVVMSHRGATVLYYSLNITIIQYTQLSAKKKYGKLILKQELSIFVLLFMYYI